MLASCANCTRCESGRCSAGARPDEGGLLCDRYEMTVAFRDEIVKKAMADIRAEIDLTILKRRTERAAMFAG